MRIMRGYFNYQTAINKVHETVASIRNQITLSNHNHIESLPLSVWEQVLPWMISCWLVLAEWRFLSVMFTFQSIIALSGLRRPADTKDEQNQTVSFEGISLWDIIQKSKKNKHRETVRVMFGQLQSYGAVCDLWTMKRIMKTPATLMVFLLSSSFTLGQGKTKIKITPITKL